MCVSMCSDTKNKRFSIAECRSESYRRSEARGSMTWIVHMDSGPILFWGHLGRNPLFGAFAEEEHRMNEAGDDSRDSLSGLGL